MFLQLFQFLQPFTKKKKKKKMPFKLKKETNRILEWEDLYLILDIQSRHKNGSVMYGLVNFVAKQ